MSRRESNGSSNGTHVPVESSMPDGVNGIHENGVVNEIHKNGAVNRIYENKVVSEIHENRVVNKSEFSERVNETKTHADIHERFVDERVGCSHISEKIEASRRLFCLSAFDEACGKRQIKNLCDYLKDQPGNKSEGFLSDLAYTLGERRSVLPWKAAISACSAQELVKSLESGETKFVHSAKAPILAYCFTGQGAQWYGMGREMIQSSSIFYHSIMQSSRYLHSLGAQWNLVGMNGFPNVEDHC